MNLHRLKKIGLGILFLLVQILLFRHLKIFQIQPDLVLIFLTWYMARTNRTSAILMAAGLGLAQDVLLDLWGLNMFSKTLLIFIGYNFIPKNANQLLTGQVLLAVFIASFLHNLIFMGLNAIIEIYTAEIFFWRQLIGNSLYTAGIAGILYLFKTR